jgi:hypothetical protein
MTPYLRYLAIAGFIFSASLGGGGCARPSSLSKPSATTTVVAPSSSPKAESLSSTLMDAPAVHQDYVQIDLTTLRSGQALVGRDPEAIALQLFGPAESVEGFFKQTVETQQVNEQKIVTLTQTGLPDDSIQGMRYHLEFVPSNGEQWRLVWAGKQYTCQPGRGSQSWSTEWCF